MRLPDYHISVNAFETGALMSIIAEKRVKVPGVWQQLVALQKKFRAEADVTSEDLGDNMVKLTDKYGTVIVRERYDWGPL